MCEFRSQISRVSKIDLPILVPSTKSSLKREYNRYLDSNTDIEGLLIYV